MSFPYLCHDLCLFSVGPSLLLGLENPPIVCITSGPRIVVLIFIYTNPVAATGPSNCPHSFLDFQFISVLSFVLESLITGARTVKKPFFHSSTPTFSLIFFFFFMRESKNVWLGFSVNQIRNSLLFFFSYSLIQSWILL